MKLSHREMPLSPFALAIRDSPLNFILSFSFWFRQPLAEFLFKLTNGISVDNLLRHKNIVEKDLLRCKGLFIELNHYKNSRTGVAEKRTKKVRWQSLRNMNERMKALWFNSLLSNSIMLNSQIVWIDLSATAQSWKFPDATGRKISVDEFFSRQIYKCTVCN